MTNTKRAIVFSSLYYNSKIKVGSHHYAEALSKEGFDVLYVSFPLSILHYIFFFKRDNLIRIRNRKVLNGEININSFIPFSLIPLINIYPFNKKWLIKKWIWLSDFFLDKTIKQKFKKADLIWIESAYFIDLIRLYKENNPEIKIYTRLADNVLAFKNFPCDYSFILNEAFCISDKIIISALSLKKLINNSYSNKLIHLPNAINIDQLKLYSTKVPSEYTRNLERKKIVYIGSIESWFDWDLVYHLAEKLPDVSIYIIGPIGKIKTKTNNVMLIGGIKHSEIGKYLHNADIGIIPFKVNDLINYVDPIKFYEYSYYGLPTVCTYWEEVSTFNVPIFLAKNKNEFVEKVKLLLNNKSLFKKEDIPLFDRDWHKNLKKVL